MLAMILKRVHKMGTKTKTTKTAVATFSNANNLNANAINAFINANGGLAKVGIQLLPTAISGNGRLFGGNATRGLWAACQPRNGKYGHCSQIMWAAIGGLPSNFWLPTANGYKASYAKKGGIAWQPTATVPTAVGQAVPLLAVHAISRNSGSSVTTNSPRQNAVMALLNGGFSANSPTWAVPQAQLVTLA